MTDVIVEDLTNEEAVVRPPFTDEQIAYLKERRVIPLEPGDKGYMPPLDPRAYYPVVTRADY